MNEHPSDSAVQQTAEIELLQMLSQKLGCDLEPHTIKLNNKSSIQIDGFSGNGRILCEVYAHVGTLRGGQPDKLAADILKLNLAANRKGGQWRKILLFADESACRLLKGSSWLAEACRDSQIEIQVVAPRDEIREKIAAAQRRQKMVNAK
jgi:hypothetical protein